MEETIKKIDCMICTLVEELHKGTEDIHTLDTYEAGEVADIIKDLADAKKNLHKALYYETVIEAMEEGIDLSTVKTVN